jgi:hypothetical protein
MSILDNNQVRTILQITGFGEQTQELQTICLNCLQQPSWVSSLTIIAGRPGVSLTIIAGRPGVGISVTVVSSLGVILKLESNPSDSSWSCFQRTPCCGVDFMGAEHCSACQEPTAKKRTFDRLAFPQTEEDEDVSEKQGSLDNFQSTCIGCFESLGADYFEATLLAGELLGLISSIQELIH